jgi:hypothetical protein
MRFDSGIGRPREGKPRARSRRLSGRRRSFTRGLLGVAVSSLKPMMSSHRSRGARSLSTVLRGERPSRRHYAEHRRPVSIGLCLVAVLTLRRCACADRTAQAGRESKLHHGKWRNTALVRGMSARGCSGLKGGRPPRRSLSCCTPMTAQSSQPRGRLVLIRTGESRRSTPKAVPQTSLAGNSPRGIDARLRGPSRRRRTQVRDPRWCARDTAPSPASRLGVPRKRSYLPVD